VEIFISAFLAYLAPFKVKFNYNITFRPNLRSGVIYLFIYFIFASLARKGKNNACTDYRDKWRGHDRRPGKTIIDRGTLPRGNGDY